MADSIRVQIVDALKAALEGITISNGYNNNLAAGSGGGGAQKADAIANQYGRLPTVLIGASSEDRFETTHTYHRCELQVFLLCAPEPIDDTTPIDDLVDALVTDIERALFAQKALDPPLGLSAVEDIHLRGHEKLPVDGDSLDGAVIECVVAYRHSLTDPRAYP